VSLFCLVVFAAGWWGTHYIRASTAAGRPIGFYSHLFEPALMTACGRGFHLSVETPAAVTRFLSQEDDRFFCASLPADLPMREGLVSQGSWLYLMLLVAAGWKILGFSWSGLPPLFGLMFGLGSACAYLIFTFGMGRLLALFFAAAFALSTLQLLELSDLRDYSKTPFMLGLLAILLSLAISQFSMRRTIALSAAFGLLVGVGYGIKPDTLIQLPLFAGTILLFLPVPLRSHLKEKAAALALAALTCFLSLWPVFHATPATGNNLWHVVLLGFMPEYGTALGVEHPVYHWGVSGSDEFVELAVGSYARRVHPEWPPMDLATAAYERGTRTYTGELAARFPADMVTRTIASIVRMPEVPFGWPKPPLPGVLDRFYTVRERILAPMYGFGVLFVLASIAAVALLRPKQGLFLLTAFAYVSAYPVIEFHNRNFFYLEVVGWLAIGFLIARLADVVRHRRLVAEPIARRDVWRRAAAGAVVSAALALSILALRSYQTRQVRRTIASYLRASIQPLSIEQADKDGTHSVMAPALIAGSADTSWSRMLFVELQAPACSGGTVTFQYSPTSPYRGLTSTLPLARSDALRNERTMLFEPVYSGFASVDLRGTRPGCLTSLSRVTGLDDEPLWLPLALDPGWRDAPLYQTIQTRENIH
jgi:hypothetical protein